MVALVSFLGRAPGDALERLTRAVYDELTAPLRREGRGGGIWVERERGLWQNLDDGQFREEPPVDADYALKLDQS